MIRDDPRRAIAARMVIAVEVTVNEAMRSKEFFMDDSPKVSD